MYLEKFYGIFIKERTFVPSWNFFFFFFFFFFVVVFFFFLLLLFFVHQTLYVAG